MQQNVIHQVRRTSTFDNFDASTPERIKVLAGFRRLADGLVAKAEQIRTRRPAFDRARMIVLHGGPGRGKTHLIEALVNSVRERAPELEKCICLSREDFTLSNIGGVERYENKPIVILDDLFSKFHRISELHTATEIKTFMEFVKLIYDESRLVIITCNFAFKEGIVKRIAEVDQIGRVLSRVEEIMSASGEYEIDGADYRQIVTKAVDPFDI